MNNKLPIDALVDLISKLSYDFLYYVNHQKNKIPSKLSYKIFCNDESASIERSARKAALAKVVTPSLVKLAFDTRRINQEIERNPRTNLQYWHRSQEFIDDEDQKKINIFAKLIISLENIKQDYGEQPEYLISYSKVLHETVNRVLRIKEGDQDIFRPQLAYLEQLLFARYRLSMDEIKSISESDLTSRILKKDEALLKRGYLKESTIKPIVTIKDGMHTSQDSIINALFGVNGMSHSSGNAVERTITITIRDSVVG